MMRPYLKQAFQHTAARRRLAQGDAELGLSHPVSTHSRPKAAGAIAKAMPDMAEFQHTAARRRLGLNEIIHDLTHRVSTHSRPKAAGMCHFSSNFYAI